MNESSLLFCNINELKFQKKTKNTCNTLYLQRNSSSRKKNRKFPKTYTLRYFNYLSK